MELISVIVPIYKVEKYLNRCVKSIVNQTYRNLEIILVDDGSPDNCPAMCDEWAKRDGRIKVIHKENGGLSDARNAGFKKAAGEFISFIDSDDWIAPEFFERLLNAIKKDGSDIAACSVEMVWEDGSPNRMLTQNHNCVLDRQEAQLALLEESILMQPVWYKLYKRELVQKIPFEKGKYHEDVFWSYQAIGNAEKVSIIDYVGYFYWQRSGSIMGEGYSLKRLDAMEAYCRRYNYLQEYFPELESKARLSVFLNCIYHGQMALRYLQGNERRKAMQYLSDIKKKYPVSCSEYSGMKTSHKVWICLAKISLRICCKLKNSIGVGF